MAFAQQQRRPALRSLHTSSSEDYSDNLNAHESFSSTVQPLYLRAVDSDRDWHVISSALPSSSSPTATTFSTKSLDSPQLSATSETNESATYRRRRNTTSDTDEESGIYSDLDNNGFDAAASNTLLPSHDGTGTFLMDDYSDLNTATSVSNIASEGEVSDDARSSSSSSPDEFTKAVNRLQFYHTEDEYDSSEGGKRDGGGSGSNGEQKSILDITKPFGGIKPPSFALTTTGGLPAAAIATALLNRQRNTLDEPPNFLPTTAGISSQELTKGVVSGETVEDTTLVSDANSRATTTNTTAAAMMTRRYNEGLSNGKNAIAGSSVSSTNGSIKYRRYNTNTSKIRKNLDSIPIHHPGGPGSSVSAALLSLVWTSLRRLTNHLLENDANTMDTWSTLVSEAVFEGCMPFNSPLYMELENGITSMANMTAASPPATTTTSSSTAAITAPSYSFFAI